MRKALLFLLFLLFALAFLSLAIAAYFNDDYSYALEYETNGNLHQQVLQYLKDNENCLKMVHGLRTGQQDSMGNQSIQRRMEMNHRFVTLNPPSIVFNSKNSLIVHYRRSIAERVAEATQFSNIIVLRGSDGFIKHCQAE